jgi:hypothetical protein
VQLNKPFIFRDTLVSKVSLNKYKGPVGTFWDGENILHLDWDDGNVGA